MNKLYLSLICGASILCAVQSVNAQPRPIKERPANIEAIHRNVPDLAEKLNLTDKQKEQAEKIRKQGREEIKKLHEKMQELRQQNLEEFEKILTKDQKTKFEIIKEEQKKIKGKPGLDKKPALDKKGGPKAPMSPIK
ncbi:MAG: hypothetical protein E7012_05230 [Alphaproteobacteria bacterium]|nr:hypothetical protein [Alphaproteobacteria bacterium]